MRQGLRIVAPLAGAGLYAAVGGGVVAVLDAATFAGSAFFMSRMRVAEEKPEWGDHHFLQEVTKGVGHVWRTLPLRQLTIGTTTALLTVGFTETLIFTVIEHLGKPASFFGVLGTLQGVGSIAGGITAAALLRRLGEVRTVGIGLGLFGMCAFLLTIPSLAVVTVGFKDSVRKDFLSRNQSLRPGAEVRARVQCGDARLAYVLLRDVVHVFYETVLFRWPFLK